MRASTVRLLVGEGAVGAGAWTGREARRTSDQSTRSLPAMSLTRPSERSQLTASARRIPRRDAACERVIRGSAEEEGIVGVLTDRRRPPARPPPTHPPPWGRSGHRPTYGLG